MSLNLPALKPLVAGKAPAETTVVVAMSGGVDSSATAALLHHLGYRVVGMTLQLWDYTPASQAGASQGNGEEAAAAAGDAADAQPAAPKKFGTCCALDDVYDAKRVCQTLGIPHYVLNMESAFKEAVIDDFVATYLAGATPIPCVRCNQKIKFDQLLKKAKSLGADVLVTGHYVVKEMADGGQAVMKQAADDKKDQTYYLFTTTQEQLDFIDFPLGQLTKPQVRQLAKDLGLHVHQKAESFDICFVPGGDYRKVVKKFAPEAEKPGNIVDEAGQVLAQHDGVVGYTVGQRKGLGGGHGVPLYVVEIRAEANEVVVGPRESLQKTTFFVQELNYLGDVAALAAGVDLRVKVRAQHEGAPAHVTKIGEDRVRVEFYNPEDQISPGQAAVFYGDDGRLLGGGFIEPQGIV